VRPPSLVLHTAASPVVAAPTTRPRAASKNATDETAGTGADVADVRAPAGVGLGPSEAFDDATTTVGGGGVAAAGEGVGDVSGLARWDAGT
jgi:hypothetical protein